MEFYIRCFLMVFFFALEFSFQKKTLRFLKKGFWMDIIWYTFAQGFILQFLAFQFISAFYSHYQWHLVTDLPIVAQLVITILIIEFLAYWIHRLNHAWWPMWRIHEVHHTSLELNWASANRIHFAEITLIRVIAGALIAILGASSTTLFYFMLFDSFMALFVHTNLKVKIGPLKYIFNSPEMHHVHHADVYEYQNCNFGDKLAIWDWVFGTAVVLSKEKLNNINFGIGYDYPQDLIGQNFYLFRRKKNQTSPHKLSG